MEKAGQNDWVADVVTIRTSVSGPRWAGTRAFLNRAAQATGVELTIEDEVKGLFSSEIFFRAKGLDWQINRFKRLVTEAVKDFNE